MTTVWVAAWSLQCCGEPFGVGDTVTWGLLPQNPADLEVVVGRRRAEQVAWHEEHHGRDDVPRRRGRVSSLEAVWVAFAPRPGRAGSHEPVPGTTVTRAIERADALAGARGDARFVGWLVGFKTLEPASVHPERTDREGPEVTSVGHPGPYTVALQYAGVAVCRGQRQRRS